MRYFNPCWLSISFFPCAIFQSALVGSHIHFIHPTLYFNPCQLSISFFPCAIFQSTGCFFIYIIILPYAIFHSSPAPFFQSAPGGFSYSFHSPHTLFQSLPALYLILSLRYFSICRVLFHIYNILSFFPMRYFIPPLHFFFNPHRLGSHIHLIPPTLYFNPRRLSISFFPCAIFNLPGAFSYI